MGNSFYTYQPIAASECMGDSLSKINNNNFLAGEAIGDLETRIASVSSNLNTRINTTNTTLSTVPYARLNDGNQSGIAPIFGARAWGRFNPLITTTVGAELRCDIEASGNVEKIVRTSTGVFTVHMQIGLPSSAYAIVACAQHHGSVSYGVVCETTVVDNKTFYIQTASDIGGPYNPAFCHFTVVG